MARVRVGERRRGCKPFPSSSRESDSNNATIMNEPATTAAQNPFPISFVPVEDSSVKGAGAVQTGGVDNDAGSKTPFNDSDPDFRQRCKSLEPACGALWNIPLGIAAKTLRRDAQTSGLFDDDEAEELAERVKLSPESLKGAKEATARIVARRTKDGEAVDIAIVSGAVVELAYGFASIREEIKKAALKRPIQPVDPEDN